MGLGSLMRSVGNKVVDASKKAVSEVGANLALDVLQGKDVQSSLQNRALQQKRKLYAGVTSSIVPNKRRKRRVKTTRRPPSQQPPLVPSSKKRKKKKKTTKQSPVGDVFDF